VPQVLVLINHPNLSHSRINSSLKSAALDIENVTVHHLDEVYATRDIDVDNEQQLVATHDGLVFQFPWYWYSTPALLKQWQDEVLTKGWAYGSGKALNGKKLLVVVSTGGSADSYSPDGQHGVTMDELLLPIATTAKVLGMELLPPFITHGVRHLSDEELNELANTYSATLKELTQ
jgi:glutathione-regulated potassium-efflux system ancillary protein KefG